MSIITTNIEQAISQLLKGELVAIPTETVYGLAANAENEEAIRKVYALKKRPLNHPLIMHVGENWDLSQWVVQIPDYAEHLIKNFWPGPLTLVFACKTKRVSPLITGNQATIALRCPQHPLAQTLLQKLALPLVAPSANPFGKISPTTAEHVQTSFREEELLILDGGRCHLGIESTIIAATDPRGYEVLRHGLINENQIEALLNMKAIKTSSTIRVPGKLDSHYQPEKPLYCFSDSQALQAFIAKTTELVFVLSFREFSEVDSEYYYHLPYSAEQTAFELYYQLRRADQSAADSIAIELPPDGEEWQGVRERILKAGKLM